MRGCHRIIENFVGHWEYQSFWGQVTSVPSRGSTSVAGHLCRFDVDLHLSCRTNVASETWNSITRVCANVRVCVCCIWYDVLRLLHVSAILRESFVFEPFGDTPKSPGHVSGDVCLRHLSVTRRSRQIGQVAVSHQRDSWRPPKSPGHVSGDVCLRHLSVTLRSRQVGPVASSCCVTPKRFLARVQNHCGICKLSKHWYSSTL